MKKIVSQFVVLVFIGLVGLSACQAPAVTPAAPVVVTVESTRIVTQPATVVVEATRVVTQQATVVVEKTTRGKDGRLNILSPQAVAILNPYLSNAGKDLDAASTVLEPLARFDDSGRMFPVLADSIPTGANGGFAADMLSITWKIKKGILWSDGTPVTADDVVFTSKYCMDKATACVSAASFTNVKSVDAVDPSTIKVTFTDPTPYPYGPFVGKYTPIIQKAQFANCVGAAAQQCTAQNTAPIGTGPFRVTSFKANDVVNLEANPKYRDPNKPTFAEVVIKGGGDDVSAARAVLQTGEADYAYVMVDQAVLRQLQTAGKGKVQTAFGTGSERLFFNFTNPDPALGTNRSVWTADGKNAHPFLSDIAVRKALSLAIDRNLLSTQFWGVAGRPVCDILAAPADFAQTVNDDCMTQDLTQANKILDDAGWKKGADGIRVKNGVRLQVLHQTTTNARRQSVQALLKQWWGQIGVATELRNVAGGVMLGNDPASPDTYTKFYADIEEFVNNFDGADPQAYLATWTTNQIVTPDKNWRGLNFSRWSNKQYDDLYVQLTKTLDPTKRIEIAKQLNNLVVQNYVELPLVQTGDTYVHSNTLLGVRANAWDARLWNIADWTRASQ